MFSIIFFIFAVVLGTSFVYLLRVEIFFEEKIAWGIVLGYTLLSIVIFLFSLFFGFTIPTVSTSLLFFILVISFFVSKRKETVFQKIVADIKNLKTRFKNGKLNAFIFLFFLSLILFATLWPAVLYQKEGDIFTIGTTGVWGDWAAHTTYISHFLYSDRISLQHPLFLGEKFSYTFMVDFLSAVLMKFGDSLTSATLIPGFVFSMALVILLYFFIFRVTKRANAAVISTFLYLFGSGFGFIYFFQKISNPTFPGFLKFLKTSNFEYTHLVENNIYWTSFINTLLLPQRSLTMGLPLAVLILTLLLLALERKNNFKYFLFAGIFTAFLPTIHIHSLIAVSVIAFFLIILLSEKNFKIIFKKLIAFYSPILILASWQMLLLFPVKSGLKLQLGWMAGGSENWFLFWAKNIGLFLFLSPIAYYLAEGRVKKIYLSFLSVFILANIFRFQPHDYDNIKIMTFWFMATAGIIGLFLVKLWEKNILNKALVIVIFPILIFSSFLDLLHLYFFPGYRFLEKNDIAMAEIIREKTSPKSIFLTSDQHNHFVPTLTGRQILMGYPGWLWTYGISYGSRLDDEAIMFGGGERAKGLLKKYEVDYVVVSPSERKKFEINEDFFDKNYPLFLQSKDTKIYKITDNETPN